MSKAFTKEDVDPPERSGRVRSASGLPPGATNYITPGGAARLRRELELLRRNGEADPEQIAELTRTLSAATVVEPPQHPESEIGLGARVTVRDVENNERTYRILGVDELDLDPDAISWISPTGRILLAAKLGERITSPDGGFIRIVKIEYPG
jgi:transcription elongation factor GreB